MNVQSTTQQMTTAELREQAIRHTYVNIMVGDNEEAFYGARAIRELDSIKGP